MRRAVLILVASLVALAASSSHAPAAGAPVRDAKFELRADGFLVALKSEVGEEKVVLTLDRRGEVAYYEAPAEFADDTVKARFGKLGDLDYTFTPTLRASCSGFAEGTFEGTFDFTGENGYVKFEAPRARGTFLGAAEKGCGDARPSTRGGKKRDAAEDEASLLIHAARSRPLRSMLVFEVEEKHRRRVLFSAFEYEREEGMLIARGAQVAAPRRDFAWNLKAGTARVDPPAPFTGSATFKRRPGGRATWRGSLRAPLLGGKPFRLAGGDFQAHLISGSPLD